MRHSPSIPIAALALLTLVAFVPTGASAQVAKVTPSSYDFGQMNQHETAHTALTITNEGAGLLIINGVDADCGCTIPTLDTTRLAPGESTEIKIEFNSKKFSGQVIKGVHINTNDPVNSQIDVLLTANVYAPLVIDPATQRVGFTASMAGETKTKRVLFTAMGDAPLEISADKTRKSLFDLKVINNVDGNPKVSALEVTLPATLGVGRHRDNVRVQTNVPEVPSADIEIRCWVREELVVEPERVSFRFRKEFNQWLRIAPFEKGLVYKITKAECDLPEIAVELIETIPNLETQIHLTGTPIGSDDPRATASKGRISGSLKIYAEGKEEPVLVVPISYIVRM